MYQYDQNRSKFDDGTYKKDLEQSTGKLKYVLNPQKYNRCIQVRPSQPGLIGRQGVSVPFNKNIIDIESDLKGITRLYSKDPTKKYKPYCPTVSQTEYNGYPCGGGVDAGFKKNYTILKK